MHDCQHGRQKGQIWSYTRSVNIEETFAKDLKPHEHWTVSRESDQGIVRMSDVFTNVGNTMCGFR